MLDKTDVFEIKVTTDNLLVAVHYAEKSLHFTFNRMGRANPYDRAINIVKGVVMEGAFKDLLTDLNVNYDLLGNTHWTKKDKYDVGINGARCDLKGFFIANPQSQSQIIRDPGWLLDCCALVPSDQVESVNLKENDIYTFPFLIGKVYRDYANLQNVLEYYYLVHDFYEYAWIKNEGKPLGRLLVQSSMNEDFSFRIGGQDTTGELVIEDTILKPNRSFQTTNTFQTALFLQSNEIPSGNLKVMAPKNGLVREIHYSNWGNIWIYDPQVYITGWIRKGEFRERSVEIPRFYKDCKQYSETQTINRKMIIKDLYAIDKFL